MRTFTEKQDERNDYFPLLNRPVPNGPRMDDQRTNRTGRGGISFRVRFALKSLMIVTAIAALLLGYTQWRRLSIMREARALEAEGFYLLWNDNPSASQRWLPHWLWPVVPKEAAAKYDVLSATNQIRFGSKVYDDDAETVSKLWRKASDQLRAMGVESIRCDVDGEVGKNYTSTHHG